jgi:hypothetical protein
LRHSRAIPQHVLIGASGSRMVKFTFSGILVGRIATAKSHRRWCAQVVIGAIMVKITRWLFNSVLRLSGRTAVDTALGAAVEAVPKLSQQSFIQVFNVTLPVTVYVRASHCRVTIRREATRQVTLQADMYRAFGVELVAEQDDAGVYIVARRKPVVGRVSRADFTITVPPDSHLVFHLTPGDVVLHSIDGLLELPPTPQPENS